MDWGGYDGRNKRRFDGPGDAEGRRQEGTDGWRKGNDFRQGYFQDQRYQGREEWGTPPPWWLEKEKEKERKRKKAEAARAKAGGSKAGGGGGGASGAGGAQGQSKSKAGAAGPVGAVGAQQQQKNKGKAGALPVTLAGGECFWCGRDGHFQSGCTFDPLCVLCSNEGHTSANCPTHGKPLPVLQLMGHAISGGGFYNINVEPLADRPRWTNLLRW
jgi:hypothetical protein